MRLTFSLALVAALAASAAWGSEPGDNADSYDANVGTSLLVQAAMRQGRDFVAQKDFRAAVRVLEAQLPKVNGHKGYLQLLEEAYRGHVAELTALGDAEKARFYQKRLAILAPTDPPDLPAAKKVKSADAALPREALANAESGFEAHQFARAEPAYRQAVAGGQRLTTLQTERWAYCRLYLAAEKVNSSTLERVDWAALEAEVADALALAPNSQRLRFGQDLLQTIQAHQPRSGRTSSASQSKKPATGNVGRQQNWEVAESPHFRVHHHDAGLAERVLQIAEETRAATLRRWFGLEATPHWADKCDVYLHEDGAAYCRETGVASDSPGHSSIAQERRDATRVHSRRIDLRLDEVHFLRAVLPHETAHVTLAGLFGPLPLPRWADEGLAVLAEPDDRIQGRLARLPDAYRDGRRFTTAQLLDLEDYPAPSMMHAFYGQGVALLLCLSERKDARTVAAFIRDCLKEGRLVALKRHFDIASDTELDQVLRDFVRDRLPDLGDVSAALAGTR